MQSTSIGHGAGVASSFPAHATGRPVDAGYLQKLEALRAPRRTFTQRMSDWFYKRPLIKDEQVAYAAWLHGTLRESAITGQPLDGLSAQDAHARQRVAKADRENTLGKLFAEKAKTPADAAGMLRRLSTLTASELQELRHVFMTSGAKAIEDRIIHHLHEHHLFSGSEAEKLAKVTSIARAAYASIVASIAIAEEKGQISHVGARKEIESALIALETSTAPLSEQLETVGKIRRQIGGAALLSAAARQPYIDRLDGVSSRLSKSVTEVEAAIQIGLKALEGHSGTYSEKLKAIAQVRLQITSASVLSEAVRQQLLEQLPKPLPQQSDIDALLQGLTVETSPDELKTRLGRLNEMQQALDDWGSGLSLDDAASLRKPLQAAAFTLASLSTRTADLEALGELSKLKEIASGLDVAGYVAFRQQLGHILGCIPSVRQEAALRRLNEMEKRDQYETERGIFKFAWIPRIAKGDPGTTDLVFSGAHWHDDAFAIKQSAIDQSDALAVKNLDVQHNLRIVVFELDRAMQQDALKTREGASAFGLNPFSSMLRQHATVVAPNTAFRATKADAKFVAWLMKNVPGVVADRNLVIASWISLSHYDPRTGLVNKDSVNELLAMLQLEGIDTASIEQFVKQGFGSARSVVQCRECIQNFAKALADDSLLQKMEEARSITFASENLARKLIKQATGMDAANIWDKSVDEAMKKALATAAPHLSADIAGSLGRLHVRRNELLSNLKKVNQTLVSRGHADRGWLEDPREVNKAAEMHNKVKYYLKLRNDYKNARAEDRPALGPAVIEARNRISTFDALTLRERPGKTDSESDTTLEQALPHLQEVAELAQIDSNIPRLMALVQKNAESALFVRRAMHLAILQEAAASDSAAFTIQEKVGAILKRMRKFGFDNRIENAQLKSALADLTKEMTANSLSLLDLCKRIAVEAGVKDAYNVAKGKTNVQSVLMTDAAKKRDETTRMIANQFKDLKLGTQFAVTFGSFGEVSVSVPLAPFFEVGGFSRFEKNNGIRISHLESGKYTVTIDAGGSVRQGVSASALAGLLAARGHVQKDGSGGFSFTLSDKAQCEALTVALATGSAVDPRLWGDAVISSTSRKADEVNASIEASLDLTVVALGAEGRVIKGNSVEHFKTAFGEIETHYQGLRGHLKGSAELAADLGSAEVEVGSERSVRKTLEKQFGMLTTGCALTLARTVVGGNSKTCLKELLPGASPELIENYLTNMGDVESGSEIFVRSRLKEAAIQKANALLAQADAQILKANTAGAASRQAERAKASDLIAQAYAVTRDASNYEPEGLGWTSKSMVEATQTRKIYENFAKTETLESNFLPFNPASGVTIAQVDIP